MSDIGDVIELIVDIPDRNCRVGMQGTIVLNHNDEAYEVEFTNEHGETLEFFALRPGHLSSSGVPCSALPLRVRLSRALLGVY